MWKRTVIQRTYGMKYSWKGHKDRNRYKNWIKRSGQAWLGLSSTQTTTPPPREGEPAETVMNCEWKQNNNWWSLTTKQPCFSQYCEEFWSTQCTAECSLWAKKQAKLVCITDSTPSGKWHALVLEMIIQPTVLYFEKPITESEKSVEKILRTDGKDKSKSTWFWGDFFTKLSKALTV